MEQSFLENWTPEGIGYIDFCVHDFGVYRLHFHGRFIFDSSVHSFFLRHEEYDFTHYNIFHSIIVPPIAQTRYSYSLGRPVGRVGCGMAADLLARGMETDTLIVYATQTDNVFRLSFLPTLRLCLKILTGDFCCTAKTNIARSKLILQWEYYS